jgi:hypothetical protein
MDPPFCVSFFGWFTDSTFEVFVPIGLESIDLSDFAIFRRHFRTSSQHPSGEGLLKLLHPEENTHKRVGPGVLFFSLAIQEPTTNKGVFFKRSSPVLSCPKRTTSATELNQDNDNTGWERI